jgi:hypothetical protein
MLKKIIGASSFILLIVGIAFSYNLKNIQAQSSSYTLQPWAWSSNIGWISLKSGGHPLACDVNDNGVFQGPAENASIPCPQSGTAYKYEVTADESGNLSGYGWSPHIGWVNFNPSSADGVSRKAYIEDDVTKGWARVCSVYASGCSGPLASNNVRGGWDGWISLGTQSDESVDYGLSFQPETDIDGWFWGGNIVGWMRPTGSMSQETCPDGTVSDGSGNCIPVTVCPSGTNDADGDGICSCNNGAPNPPTCTPPTTPLTPEDYDMNPKIVSKTSDKCTLYDWKVSGGTGAVSCKIDGGAAIPYTGSDSYEISVGKHTLTCTDTLTTVTFAPAPQCRLNPNYGEF